MEEKIGKENVELAVIKSDTKKLEFRPENYIEGIIQTLSWEMKVYTRKRLIKDYVIIVLFLYVLKDNKANLFIIIKTFINNLFSIFTHCHKWDG